MTLGVVLGGGGVAGIAWEVGVIVGLAEAGVRLDSAAGVVGTSAGSVVGASLAGGADMSVLLDEQRRPRPSRAGTHGSGAGTPLTSDASAWAQILGSPGGQEEMLQRMGALASSADTVPEAQYKESMAAMLPSPHWPQEADLRVTAVDAGTGTVQVWDRESGVTLADAVAASCALPGVFPPVTIGGRTYFDGGMASPTHADRVGGCTELLVIAPFTMALSGPGLEAEIESLGPAVRSSVIDPDTDSLAAIGFDPMDPSTRAPAAEAGLRQGRAEAMRVGIALSL